MATKTQILGYLIPTIALALSASAVATNAAAQVIEISADGTATTYDAPAVFSSEGVRPILPSKPHPAAALQGSALKEALTVTANRHALDPLLLEAVAWTESRFRQNAVSPKGAVGLMQLMDGTARALGVDRFDWRQNIEGGATYLSQLLGRYRGDVSLTLAAYNAGPGAVDRHGGIPPFLETQAYVRTILGHMNTHPLAMVNQPDAPSVFLIAP
jgi:soluble lytic murein transglycosylase-like protein